MERGAGLIGGGGPSRGVEDSVSHTTASLKCLVDCSLTPIASFYISLLPTQLAFFLLFLYFQPSRLVMQISLEPNVSFLGLLCAPTSRSCQVRASSHKRVATTCHRNPVSYSLITLLTHQLLPRTLVPILPTKKNKKTAKKPGVDNKKQATSYRRGDTGRLQIADGRSQKRQRRRG